MAEQQRRQTPPDDEPGLYPPSLRALTRTCDDAAALAAALMGAPAAMALVFGAGRVAIVACHGCDAATADALLPAATTAIADHGRIAGLALLRRPSLQPQPLNVVAIVHRADAAGDVSVALVGFGRRRRTLRPTALSALDRLADTLNDVRDHLRHAGRLEQEVARQRAAVKASQDSERLLVDYLLTATDGIWQTDAQHRFQSTTTDLSTLKVAQARVYGRTPWELADADPDRQPLWAGLRETFEANRPFRGFEYSLRDDAGRTIWREVNGNPIVDHAGGFVGFRGTSRDITDRKQAEVALREMDSRLTALAGSGLVGIMVGEGRAITEMNDEFLRIIGHARSDFPSGRTHLPALLLGADRHECERGAGIWLERQAAHGPVEQELVHKDGRAVPVLLSPVILDRESARWLCLVQDITDRKRNEALIRELADRDALTGLLNRRSFLERFTQVLGRARDAHRSGALILLDLDNFKNVNDTLGHPAGDRLLVEIGARMASQVRAGDVVARLGGDEFAVIVADEGDPEQVEAIARHILERLLQPVHYEGRTLLATASAGVALFPQHGLDSHELLKCADIALYGAKARGRRCVVTFAHHMRVAFDDQLALDAELQRAVLAQEFTLAFQPTVKLADGSHHGFEALLRWAHPERGLLSPASFISNLENNGLIVPVGRYVLAGALAQLRQWQDAGLNPGQMAVNLATAQLRGGDLVDEVERQLSLNWLDAAMLRVEVTENVLLDDNPDIGKTLDGLHRLGVHVALDDFGTGFASLSHLKRVRVNTLKIDRSFVRDIGQDPGDAAITRTIINLAHSLGMTVVAEGIMTEQALAFLRLNGCDEGQGFLLAKPLTALKATTWLRERVTRPSGPAPRSGYSAAGRPPSSGRPRPERA